jgi:hypothetical protein
MTQGKKTPSFIINHVPEREGATWTRIGALWATKNEAIFSGGIEYLPLDVLNGGRINIVIQKFEPKQD